MSAELYAYVGLLLVSFVLSSTIAGYGFLYARRRPSHRTVLVSFGVVMLFASLWSVTYAVQLWQEAKTAKSFWLLVTNVWSVFVPASWILFTLSYTGREHWVTPRLVGLLSLQPVVMLVVFFTAPGLLYTDAVVVAEPFPVLDRDLGPAFYFHAFYSYTLNVAGSLVIAQWARRQESVFRGQAGLLLFGATVPLVLNVAFVLGVGPNEHVNLTSVVFTISGLAFWVAIVRYRLLDVVPVGRESVIETMRDGYLVVDERDRVVDANPAANRLLGRSLSAGDPVSEALPESVDLLDRYRSDRESDEDARAEFVLGEGATRRYVDAAVSSPGTSDDLTLVLLRDITDQRRTERRFQTLIENSSDIVTVLDSAGTITYQSPSTSRILGYEPRDMVGTSAFEYVHPDDQERLATLFSDGLDDGTAVARAEYRTQHADGDWRIHESVGRNLLADPLVEGIVVNSRDVTDRRERERELAATNERLDQFASVVSHDLRNPLNIAQGYVDLLRENVDGDAAAHLDEIETSHDRMETIVADVLALARDGETVTDRTAVPLDEAAQTAWRNVDTADATLSVETATTVQADRSRLVRALENLFRNAVEHGSTSHRTRSGDAVEHGSTSPLQAGDAVEHGDSAVTVSVDSLPDGDGFVVADDGPGIPDDCRDDLFEPGVTGTANGTGLGLAIVSQIADAHDWTVQAVSGEARDGKFDGARFEFRVNE
ncbi:histidine kinase N-terminal 7TM domain-containing protein [Haloarchaeobius sp. DFWS5]|uniref:histidine kinase N-terminal 7TM domain-containing protein n=1 Tax=Haloarchaeobius sp. DFWS5 TaxID=3446114 RepID=UPI003EC02DBC